MAEGGVEPAQPKAAAVLGSHQCQHNTQLFQLQLGAGRRAAGYISYLRTLDMLPPGSLERNLETNPLLSAGFSER